MKKSTNKNRETTKGSAQRKRKSFLQGNIIQSIDHGDQHRIIEEKTYELYESRGDEQGSDQDDWYEAEKIILPAEPGSSNKSELI